MEQWLSENALSIIGTFIGSGMLCTAFQVREDVKARRISNLIAITANHRELVRERLHNPKLIRFNDPKADLTKEPVTAEEEIYLNLVIANMYMGFEASKGRLLAMQDGVKQDIREFFSLPIPKAIWQKAKSLQNHDFEIFIDSALK